MFTIPIFNFFCGNKYLETRQQDSQLVSRFMLYQYLYLYLYQYQYQYLYLYQYMYQYLYLYQYLYQYMYLYQYRCSTISSILAISLKMEDTSTNLGKWRLTERIVSRRNTFAAEQFPVPATAVKVRLILTFSISDKNTRLIKSFSSTTCITEA